MYQSKVLAPQGGILRNGGNGTFKQKNVPNQYQLNLAEPGTKSVGVLRGASASAAPIIAVNKERYDNRSSNKQYDTKPTSGNLTFFLDFRDAMKLVSGTESSSSYESLKPETKPVPTHSKPLHRLIPLFVQSCIDMNYGKDNALYDNTSKTLKFSTPANGRIVPERKELFGMLLDDLHRIENGQFPVHSEWFDSFGTKMTPSKAKGLLSVLERISRLIQFTKENNTWLGKGCDHIRSIMNALLIKNLIQPSSYTKQKYYSFFYHLFEQSYDEYQGRAIRGEPKPKPLVNATLPTLPFQNTFLHDVLMSHAQEKEAARQDLMTQTHLSNQVSTSAVLPSSQVNQNILNSLSNAAGTARSTMSTMTTATNAVARGVGRATRSIARGVGTGLVSGASAIAGGIGRAAGHAYVNRDYLRDETFNIYQSMLGIGSALGTHAFTVLAQSIQIANVMMPTSSSSQHQSQPGSLSLTNGTNANANALTVQDFNNRMQTETETRTPQTNEFQPPTRNIEFTAPGTSATEYRQREVNRNRLRSVSYGETPAPTPRELIRGMVAPTPRPAPGSAPSITRRLDFTNVGTPVDVDTLLDNITQVQNAYGVDTPSKLKVSEIIDLTTAESLLQSIKKRQELNKLSMNLEKLVRPNLSNEVRTHSERIIATGNPKVIELGFELYKSIDELEIGTPGKFNIDVVRKIKRTYNKKLKDLQKDNIITQREYELCMAPGIKI